jgi:hypothetical protein
MRPWDSLAWRNIGPHRGGRVVAVAGHPEDPMVFYFGSTGGGVWRTTNGGATWVNISDGFFRSASVGALAVADADPAVLYAGMGESCVRGNVSFGDGVYRSVDGGRTWIHLGLADTRHIARVRIDPRDPDRVYVAALGHPFGPHPARGVYRSHNGGRTWSLVLPGTDTAGAIDLALDPHNPRIVYAALWQVQRRPWRLDSGGPASGLYRSDDGGDHWERLGPGPTLPDGPWGRIAVAPSPGKPGRVYALIEAHEGGLFRSDDFGEHWELATRDPAVRGRPWYFTHLFADPASPDGVYVLAFGFLHSTDGGRHFRPVATPHPDHHDLWIDRRNPRRMIHGADGGAAVSFDGGASWTSIDNQPTGEFYHLAVDPRHPYRIVASQQDNSTISVPSENDFCGLTAREWYDVGGGESGHLVVSRADPDIVFAGSSSFGEGGRITRFNRRTNLREDVSPWPVLTRGLAASQYRWRFQWTTPIAASPHQLHTLYVGANVVFRSRDDGQHWEIISPDLTRNDPAKQEPTGGPITLDQSGVEVYDTVFSLAESPARPGLLWAGTDDGLVHCSEDDGAHWRAVTPPSLPEWATVTTVEPHPRDPDRVYLAATRYKLDDPRPYVFRTNDRGRTWVDIAAGLPADEYVRVVRADPVVDGLLWCGTERGVWVSRDDGAHWDPLRLNLPVVPVHDLAVHGTDLVAATHGRGLWILDDITPIRQWAEAGVGDTPHLFSPRPTVRWIPLNGRYVFGVPEGGGFRGSFVELPAGHSYVGAGAVRPGDSPRLEDAGQNPPRGALFHYWLPTAARMARIRVWDAAGGLVHEATVDASPGAHRHVWDLRLPLTPPLEVAPGQPVRLAPRALPGSYRVRFEVDAWGEDALLTIVQDPRRTGPPDAYERNIERVRALARPFTRAAEWVERWRMLSGPWPPAPDSAEDGLAAWREAFRPLLDRLLGSGRGGPAGLAAQAAYVAELLETADGEAPAALVREAEALASELQSWTATFEQTWQAAWVRLESHWEALRRWAHAAPSTQ